MPGKDTTLTKVKRDSDHQKRHIEGLSASISDKRNKVSKHERKRKGNLNTKENARNSERENTRFRKRESTRLKKEHITPSARTEAEEEEWARKVWKAIMAVLGTIVVVGIVAGVAVHFSSSDAKDTGAEPDEGGSYATDPPDVTRSTTASPFNDSEWNNMRGECGISKIQPDLELGRIVGGDEAKKNSWPWQISLVKYASFGNGYASVKHICGGTLVGPNMVVTATHCFLNSDRSQTTTKPDAYRVIVGGHVKSKLTGGAKMTKISKIIHHPLNNLAVFSKLRVAPVNDITLLVLRNLYNPSKNTPVVEFACLPKPKVTPAVGKRCWTSGWGRTMNTGFDDKLKQIVQPIVSQQTCTKFYHNMINYDQHLCSMDPTGGTCQGDSGGPLVCQGADKKWTLYGATSFGPVPCATAPGVFATVANYVEWLCCHLENHGPCEHITCKMP